jgi:hypothetical protein
MDKFEEDQNTVGVTVKIRERKMISEALSGLNYTANAITDETGASFGGLTAQHLNRKPKEGVRNR